MKVAIFDTEHFEVTFAAIRFFDNGRNDITIYVYEKSFLQLKYLLRADAHKYAWVIKKEAASKYTFLLRLFIEMRNKRHDLLYLVTISDNLILYALLLKLLPKTRVVLTIHNINSMFSEKSLPGFKSRVRSTGKKWLVRSVKEFNVISITMVEHLRRRLTSNQVIHTLPGGLFDEAAVLPVDKPLLSPFRIVIPGTIDNRRRNYQVVFDVLEACRQQEVPVDVVLLGGFSESFGQHIREKCLLYAVSYRNLTFYDVQVVDQSTFEQEMNAAHLVLLPTVIHTVLFDGVEETYGLSTCSGNIFDIIKHAKPFIAPAGMRIEPALELCCLRYNQPSDIISHLLKLHHSPELFAELQSGALDAAGNYTLEKARERNKLYLH
jgi:hypothetical protein